MESAKRVRPNGLVTSLPCKVSRNDAHARDQTPTGPSAARRRGYRLQISSINGCLYYFGGSVR